MDLLLGYEDDRSWLHPLFERYAQVTRGAPGRCPVCDEFGFIDADDIRGGRQAQHCRSCGYRWEYRFKEDGTILEVRGYHPIPSIVPAEDVEPVRSLRPLPPPPPLVQPAGRHRVVPRRRQRPLRAERSKGSS